MTAKTANERKADERARRRAEGKTALTLYTYPQDREAVRAYAQTLAEARERKGTRRSRARA